MTRARVVVDTNVLVSRLILPQSLPAQALRRAELEGCLLISEATMWSLYQLGESQEFPSAIGPHRRICPDHSARARVPRSEG